MKRRFSQTLLIGLIIISLFPATAFARPAFTGDVEIHDGDGRTVIVRNHGDEFFSYLTDSEGNLIYAHNDGRFYYVVRDDTGEGLTLGGVVGGKLRKISNFFGLFQSADTKASDRISVIDGIGSLKEPLQDLQNAQAQMGADTGSFFALRRGFEFETFNDDEPAYDYSFEQDPLHGIWVGPRKRIKNPPRGKTCALLVLMVDFEDIKCVFSEADWHQRIFLDGVSKYYTEVSNKTFTYEPAKENYSSDGNPVSGTGVNDGVIHVKLPIKRPGYVNADVGQNYNMGAKAGFYWNNDHTKRYGVFSDGSLFAYAAAAAKDYFNFAQYDGCNDGKKDGYISPTELAIMVVVAGKEAAAGATPGAPMSWAHSGTLNNYLYAHNGLPNAQIKGIEGAVKLDGVQLYKYTLMGENINPNYNYDTTDHTGAPAKQAQFGTPCHELGHDLGLMDLYDTTYTEQTRSVLSLSLMAYGCDGKATQDDEPGSSPVMLDPHSKIFLGFSKAQVVTKNGLYHLNESSDYANANILRVNTDNKNVYYLIENRTFTGYDKGMALQFDAGGGGGLVYWRINEDVVNKNWYYNKINSESGNYGIMPEYVAYSITMQTDGVYQWEDFSGCKPFRNAVTSALQKEYAAAGTEKSFFSMDPPATSMKLWIAPLPIKMEPEVTFDEGDAPTLVAKLDYDDPNGNDLIHVTDLDKVSLSDVVLSAPEEYTAREGSLLVDFNPGFLNTLSAGNYPLRITLKNGLYAADTIRVEAETDAMSNPGDRGRANGRAQLDIPNTGDASFPMLWAGILLLAAGGLLLLRKRRRSSQK